MSSTAQRSTGRSGAFVRRAGRWTVLPSLLVVLAPLAGCSGQSDAAAPGAGSYPIATPGPQNSAVPSVSAGGYQLVSAGNPVQVHLPEADLVAQVSGPDVAVPTPAPGQPITATAAPGVLTVTFTATRGSIDVPASTFLGLDEDRDPLALAPDAASVPVSPGHPGSLHLSSQFASGHTTLTWQPEGSPLITWDFTVEID